MIFLSLIYSPWHIGRPLITYLGQSKSSFQTENLSLAGIFCMLHLFFIFPLYFPHTGDELLQAMNDTTLTLNFTDNSGQIQRWYKGIKVEVIMKECTATLSHVIHNQEPEERCDTHKFELPLGSSFTNVNLINKQNATILLSCKGFVIVIVPP